MSLLGIYNKNFGAKIFSKFFITVLIIFLTASNISKINSYKTEEFLLEPELNKELFSRMNYYNSLINDLKLMEKVSIEIKNNRIYLKANQDFAALDHVFLIPKFLFFTSCDLFPFKEYFLDALNQLNKNSKVDLHKFSNNLILAYNLMYYKFADKEKAKKHYLDHYKDQGEKAKEIEAMLPFEVHREIKLYLDNLPQKNTRSLFFFNEEEMQLAKDLGIDLITKVVFENTHNQLIEFFKKNLPEEVSKIILEFIDRQDDFNSIISFLNNSEIFMEEKVYNANFVANNKIYFYEDFKKTSLTPNSPLNSVCRYITPLLDLLDIKPMKNIDKTDNCSPFLNKVVENPNYVFIMFNKRFNQGENFHHTSSDLLQSEILYSLTGNVIRDNPTDFLAIIHPLRKEDFTKEAIDLCHQAGCSNMNLNYIFSLGAKDSKIPLFVFRNTLNYETLKIFKVKFIKKFDYHAKQNYLTDRYIDYATEIKADIEYLNTLQIHQQMLPDYGKVLQDYLKLRGIYKGMENFNQANLVKIFTGLENKVNLVEVALLKGEIIKLHEDMILKKMVKDVQEDVKRLKAQYLS